MKIKIPTLLAFLILVSCEKDVTDQFRNQQQNLFVISGQLTAGKNPVVNLSRSVTMTEPDTLLYLNDAIVELQTGGNHHILNPVGGGFYSSGDLVLETGQKITLNCSGEGLPDATVTTTIPDFPVISNVEFALDDSFYFTLDVVLEDPGNTEDYYSFYMSGWKREIMHEHNYQTGEESIDTSQVYLVYSLSLHDSVMEYTGGPRYFGFYEPRSPRESRFHFSDKLINGSTHTIRVQDWLSQFYNDTIPEINIHVVKRDEHFFRFVKSYINYDPYNELPIAQPVQIYSNIEEGFGLVTAESPIVYTIDMSQWYNDPDFLNSMVHK